MNLRPISSTLRSVPTIIWSGLSLVLLQFLILAPWFSEHILPQHDLFVTYSVFHGFYRAWFYHGELMRWLSLVNWGVPSNLAVLAHLRPSSYLVGAIGSLFDIRDTLILFKAAVALDHLFFLAGCWALSGCLYRFGLARWTVCASLILAQSWFLQPYFSFWFYYLLPQVFYCLYRFAEEYQPEWLWRAALVEFVSQAGGLVYGPPVHLLLILIFLAVVVRDKRAALSSLAHRSAWTSPTLGCALLIGLALGILTVGAFEGMSLVSPGRDQSGSVSLQTFLEYGRLPLMQVFAGLTSYALALAPVSYYIGLLPLLGLFVTGVRCQDRQYWAFAAMAFLLMAMTMGGVIAKLLFHFPAMSSYRHLSLLWGLWKLPAIIAAGFGLDFLAIASTAQPNRAMTKHGTGAVVAVICYLAVETILHWRPEDAHLAFEGALTGFEIAGAPLALLIGAATAAFLMPQRGLAPILALVVIADLAMFQIAVQTHLPFGEVSASPHLFEVEPLKWPATLASEPGGALARDRRDWVHAPRRLRHAVYDLSAQFVGEIVCPDRVRRDLATAAFVQLLRHHGEPRPGVPTLSTVLGCGAPTVRIVGNPSAVVTVTAFRDGYFRIDVQNSGTAEGILAVAQSYHPKWTASVDGYAAQPFLQDGAILGVRVPPGTHEVELRFGDAATALAHNVLAVGTLAFAAALILLCLPLLAGLAPGVSRGA